MNRWKVTAAAVATLCSMLAGPAWAGLNVWTGGGPPGAAIRAVLVTSPTVIYVGTIGSGVFKSTDGGVTWAQTEPAGAIATRSIRALARDSVTGTIYAGSDDAVDADVGVFQTVDGGASWTPIGTNALGLTNRKVQALAWDGTTLYAGTRQETIGVTTVPGGVFKWNGSAWTDVSNTLPNQSAKRVQALAVDSRLDPPVVYAGTQGEGVFKSRDGGLNWTRIDNPANQGFRSDCLEKPEILALAVDETIPLVIIPPGDPSGAVLYAGATGEIGNTGCDPTPANGGHQGQGAGFFRYVPQGFNLGCNTPGSLGCWDRRMGGAFEDLLPDTVSAQVWSIALKTDVAPTRIYIGTDVGVFTSNDSAGNWDGLPQSDPAAGLIGLPVRALGIDPAASCSGGTVRLFAGTGGRGMFARCPNVPLGQQGWTATSGGLTATRALSVAVASRSDATSKIYAGLSGGGIIASVDGGTSWQSTGETDLTVRALAPDPGIADTIYAATAKGVIKTTNGSAWTIASTGLPLVCNFPGQADQENCLKKENPNDPNPPRTVRSVLVDPANTGVVFAAVGGVHASVDGGATWAPINGTAPGNLPDLVTCARFDDNGILVCPGNGAVSAFAVDHRSGDPVWGTLYVGTDGSDIAGFTQGQGVFRSTDGGGTWSPVNSGIDPADRFITALALDPLPQAGALVTLYAGTTTGKVYRTDGGTNWVSVSDGLPGNAVTALAIEVADPSVIYAALDGAGVYVSANGGFTWAPLSNGLSSLALDVLGLAVDSTRSPRALYAATLGAGMHDRQIEPAGHPLVFINAPPAPYPQQAATSPIDVSATVLDDTGVTKVLWSTSRGHAGLATFGAGWTASVTLEPGLNVITLTAVDTDSNEGSASLTVVFSPPAPKIFVNPLGIAFGTVPVGGATNAQAVTVRNDGDSDLILGTVTLGGANPDQFKIPPAQDLCSGKTLAPAATCTVAVRFKPTAIGAHSATLDIPSNDPDAPTVAVTLSGTGGGPDIFVDPLSIAFGTVPAGGATNAQVVTVRNDGNASLVLGMLTLGGANPDQFKLPPAQDLCSGQTLAPAATCTVAVRFKPTSTGAHGATLDIPSNDPDEPAVTVTLSGTGSGPEIFVGPASLAFGGWPVGGATGAQIVTVRNDGTANLVLGTVTLGGANPKQFKLPPAQNLCSGQTLAPAATCTVAVRFKPTTAGAKTATLVIPSNDFDEPTSTVALTGTGL